MLGSLSNDRAVPVYDLGIDPARVAQVAGLIDKNQIAASSALPLFTELAKSSSDVEETAKKLGLIQSSDTAAIDAAIDALIAQNPKALQEYRAGKQAAMGALMGAVMKSARGLNPKIVQERLREKIGQ